MAWYGYFEYDGTEIVNLSRVTTYARNFGLNWLRTEPNAALGPMLGESYASPLVDDAPWMDPDEAASFQFFGAYPLEVNGLEDSTVSAAVTESVLDGGVVNRPRRTTRPVVFSLALLGSTEAAVEYGMRWLKSALSGAPCQGLEDCTGSQLCYLSSEPALPVDSTDPTDCLDPLLRSLHKVTITTGPVITAKFAPPSGGNIWTVSFTAVAGDPFEFLAEKPLVEGFLSGTPTIYVDPAYPSALANHSWVNVGGVITEEYSCTPATYRPLYDPDCPLVIPPPGVPSVPVSCFAFPGTFTRRFFTVPEQEIPLWGASVPIITFRTTTEVRNMRLRFYADVLGTGDPEQDPCAYCGDIVFSYIPAGSTLVFDGTERIVTVQTPGQPVRRGDSVVFKSDGTPFDWPELTCGFAYLVAVDLPSTETPFLMTTSNFEDGLTTDWTAINSATMANSNSQAHTGTQSLRLTMPSGSGTPGAVRNNAFTVTAGQRVTASAWIYMVSGGITTSFGVQANGVSQSDVVSVPVTVAGKWQESTYSFTATTSGTMNVYLLAPGTTGAGDLVYADDVQAYIYNNTMTMDMSLVGKVL